MGTTDDRGAEGSELNDFEQVAMNRFGLVAAVRLWLSLPDLDRQELVEELIEEDETGYAQANEFFRIMGAIGMELFAAAESTSESTDYQSGAYL